MFQFFEFINIAGKSSEVVSNHSFPAKLHQIAACEKRLNGNGSSQVSPSTKNIEHKRENHDHREKRENVPSM